MFFEAKKAILLDYNQLFSNNFQKNVIERKITHYNR